MEYVAYFPAVKIEKEQTVCGLTLSGCGGCMAARAADGLDRNALYHRAVVLQSYMVLDAWERREQELLLAAGEPLVYEKPEIREGAVSFDRFLNIPSRAAENRNEVFWIAKALTEKSQRSRYLSLYRGLRTMAGEKENLWETLKSYSSSEDAGRFSQIIHCLQAEAEDLEERGTAYESPDFDQELFERLLLVWETMYQERRKGVETE